jgi:hypothetical protein
MVKLGRIALRDREAVSGIDLMQNTKSSCPGLTRATINLRKNILEEDGLPGRAGQ